MENGVHDLYKRQLGQILIARDWITQGDLDNALSNQKSGTDRLGKVLVDMGLISEETVTEARSIQLDVSYINLEECKFDPAAVGLITGDLAWRYKLIPVREEDDKLIVAMANPLDVEASEIVERATKSRVDPALATEWRIIESIEKFYGPYVSQDLHESVQQATSNIEVSQTEATEEEAADIDEVKRQVQRAPIVRMVNLLLTQAVRKKASDIHIEPRMSGVDIRFRMDGELKVIRRIPKALHPAVSSRIKIMAELDIAERRLPQDGRISVKIDGKSIDVRVSTSPTIHGERVVLRILDSASGLIPLEELGFAQNDLRIFNSLISNNQGIVLVTGPTGSGKTTTLYAALNTLKAENVNIMTVEDPVEFMLDGTNQTNVHHKIGLTFANQLRAILRQDPDIVLVGEIRDQETADVAFRAALTGHLVLSTLHCNDAPSAITRLLEMELEPFLVGSAINGVLAQRLVRVLCDDCKEAYEADDLQKSILGLSQRESVTLYRPTGCSSCDRAGFRGRTAIREIMVMTSEIRNLALAKASADQIQVAAVRQGMTTMKQDGIRQVLAGITTLEEVQRKVFLEPEIHMDAAKAA